MNQTSESVKAAIPCRTGDGAASGLLHLSAAEMAAIAPDLFRTHAQAVFFQAPENENTDFPTLLYDLPASLCVSKPVVTMSDSADTLKD